MMKKSLTQAVALAVAIGAAASAHAANVNQDGQGEVLLYPVYTAEEGNFTAVSVTNTTDKYKAVKVRFVEGMNSKEVLDFNLYLSPHDVWSGAVTLNAAGNPVLVTQDTSCTAGQIPSGGQPFVNYEYGAGSKKDTLSADFWGVDRARVGHLEMIEMGEIPAAMLLVPGVPTAITAAQAIKHVNGVPGNCDAVRNAFNAGGVWATNASDDDSALGGTGLRVTAPTGGLYGTAAVVNVAAGWQSSYDALAVDNTTDPLAPVARHNVPGSVSPDFSDVHPAVTFKDGTSATTGASGVDAMSAIIMKESIQNDYIVGAALNAQTDMVVTFPTKRYYVNGALPALPAAQIHGVSQPFTAGWNKETAEACENIAVIYTDNEENRLQLEKGQFSPQPESDEIALCHETNIFSISGSKVLGGKFVRHNLELDAAYTQGWINIDFTAAANGFVSPARELPITPVAPMVLTNLLGLPVIGHSLIVTQNGNVGGLLSNYGATFDHKATTTIK